MPQPRIVTIATDQHSSRRINFIDIAGTILFAVAITNDSKGIEVRTLPSIHGHGMAVMPEADNTVRIELRQD